MYLDVGFFYGRFLLIISFFDGAPGGFKRRSEGRADGGGACCTAWRDDAWFCPRNLQEAEGVASGADDIVAR